MSALVMYFVTWTKTVKAILRILHVTIPVMSIRSKVKETLFCQRGH